MAITIGNTSNSGDPGAVTSYSWNHTCLAGTTCLVVVVTGSDTSGTDFAVASITYDGVNLEFASAQFSAQNLGVSIWYLLNPTTGSSLSLVVTHGGKVTDPSAYAIDLLGTATSSVVDSNDGDPIGGGTTCNPIVSPAATGSIAVGGMHCSNTAVTTVSVTTGTQVGELDLGSTVSSCAYAFESGGTASIAWGLDLGDVNGRAVTFKAASAATGNPTDYQNLIITSSWFLALAAGIYAALEWLSNPFH